MLPVLRILFWSALGVTLSASLLGVLLSYYLVMPDTAHVLMVVSLVATWIAVILVPIVSSKTKRERRTRYERAYPTRDALLQAVDGAAIRAVRDSEGSARAIRALRKQVPDVPLAEAVAVVNSL